MNLRRPRRFALCRLRTWAAGCAIAFGLLGSRLAPTSLAADVSKEYQVKAVYLFRLAQFVAWPSNSFKTADSPLIIGVLGENPFGGALDTAVQGETAQGRKVEVHYFQRLEEIQMCHVLYVSRAEARRAKEIIGSLENRPVLTVSDAEEFAKTQGGMVRFYNEQNKVKIRINRGATTAVGLALDARLLRMAEVVRP